MHPHTTCRHSAGAIPASVLCRFIIDTGLPPADGLEEGGGREERGEKQKRWWRRELVHCALAQSYALCSVCWSEVVKGDRCERRKARGWNGTYMRDSSAGEDLRDPITYRSGKERDGALKGTGAKLNIEREEK